MKKLNDIFERAFNMPTWKHFIVWYFASATVFVSGLYWIGITKFISYNTIGIIGSLVALLAAVFASITVERLQRSRLFYKHAEDIHKRADGVVDAEALIKIRAELLSLYEQQQYVRPYREELEKTFVLIDARLKHEFKIKI